MRYDYKLLVVGLGSMGKRRVSNLKQLGFTRIYGFDTREDRMLEAVRIHQIVPVSDVDQAILEIKPDALIISVPPDVHHIYMQKAIDSGLHFFVEASVVDTGLAEMIAALKGKDLVAAPSNTLYFHPAIQLIMKIVRSGELGTVTNFIYHCGQYLPDWHTYEPVQDYYVSKKETGGAREIVPFELTWITKLFGFPEHVSGVVINAAAISGAEEIDDTYNALLAYKGFIVNIVVDVVSRCAVRKLLINGTQKQLTWNWDENCVKVYDPSISEWNTLGYKVSASAEGYNKNITEQMYADELIGFFAAIAKEKPFFNDLEYDRRVLNLLYTIERSWTSKKTESFKD